MAFRCLSLNIFNTTKYLRNAALFKKDLQYFVMGSNNFFSEPVSKDIELISNEKISLSKESGKVPLIKSESDRSLAVMFEWMSAEKKGVHKYVNLYLDRGYDVLAISLSLRNLLFPVSGSQITASEALEFLAENTAYKRLLIHGFSIGGYVWGEVLVKMESDLPKYEPVIKRINGQIWDSIPNVTAFHKGFGRAVFPNNSLLRFAVEKSIASHLRVFQNVATKHYYKANDSFHNPIVRAPTLLYTSKNDRVASYDGVLNVKNKYEARGIKTYVKCWEKSKHVGHLKIHKEEYIKALDEFLVNINESQKIKPERIQAKL